MSDQQHMNRGLFILLLLACALLAACAHTPGPKRVGGIRGRFMRDYNCASAEAEREGKLWRVQGCGLIVHYRCSASYVIPGHNVVIVKNGGCETVHTARNPQTFQKLATRVVKDGVVVWRAQTLTDGVELRLYGAPVKQPDDVLVVWSPRRVVGEVTACELDLIVDGERMPLPIGQFKMVERRAEYSVHVPLGWVERVGYAQRAVGSLCGRPFEVGSSALEVLRNFVIRYKEERTLATPAEEPAPAPPPPTQQL